MKTETEKTGQVSNPKDVTIYRGAIFWFGESCYVGGFQSKQELAQACMAKLTTLAGLPTQPN